MENCLRSIKQVDTTHRGLGIYLILVQLCVNADRSIIVIAPSGSGKKVLVNGFKTPSTINQEQDIKWDSVTATQLVNRIGFLHDAKMLWRIEEFGTLTDFHRKTLMTIGSKIITDKSYYRDMGSPSKPIVIDIKNCELVMVIGIQPTTLADMIHKEVMWEALGKDRFMKVVILNPLREKEIDTFPDFTPEVLETTKFKVPEKPLISKIFRHQVSDGRMNRWCRDLISSFMTYEGYSEYQEKYELQFMELFGEIISLFSKLSYTETLDQPIKVNGGSMMLLNEIAKHNYNGGITQHTLADTFRIYRPRIDASEVEDTTRLDTIRYHARVLLSNDLIRKSNVEPITYHLSDGLTKFFNWYQGILS